MYEKILQYKNASFIPIKLVFTAKQNQQKNTTQVLMA